MGETEKLLLAIAIVLIFTILMITTVVVVVNDCKTRLSELEVSVDRIKHSIYTDNQIARYNTLKIDTMYVFVSAGPKTEYIMVQDSIMTKLYGSKWKSKLQKEF